MHRLNHRGALGAILGLVWGCVAVSHAQAPVAREVVEVEIFILAAPDGTDSLAVSYLEPIPDDAVQRDFTALAQALGLDGAKVKVTQKPNPHGEQGIVTGEATLGGLTDWRGQTVKLDPVLQTFRRYHRLSVTWIFVGPFQVTEPLGDRQTGPLRWRTMVGPGSVSYQVWLNQDDLAGGVVLPATVQATRPTRRSPWLLVGFGAVALTLIAGGGWLIWRGRRREVAGGAPNVVREGH